MTPDDDNLTAAIQRMNEADQRHREALERLQRHQAATANLRMFPHRRSGIPDGPDPTKISEAKP